MNITIHIPDNLGARLARLQNRDEFVTEALEQEFARKMDIDRLEHLAQRVSTRAAAMGLTAEKLEQLLDEP